MVDEIIAPGGERASSHTSGRMSGRIQIVGRVSGRRRWTVEQKLAILRDAFGPVGFGSRGDRAPRGRQRRDLYLAPAGDVGRVDRADCAVPAQLR